MSSPRDDFLSDASYQMHYGGKRAEIEIPLDHPWFDFLNRHRHKIMDDGGLAPHGILTATLGGVTQRFDLTEVRMESYPRHPGDGLITTIWRMYGDPTDG